MVLMVLNCIGDMVLLLVIVVLYWMVGLVMLNCYNGYLLFDISGCVVIGMSLGVVMVEMEWFVGVLLVGIGFDWVDVVCEE